MKDLQDSINDDAKYINRKTPEINVNFRKNKENVFIVLILFNSIANFDLVGSYKCVLLYKFKFLINYCIDAL